MNVNKMAWNRSQTSMVVLNKIKEYTITENINNKKFSVRGWFNKENSFLFGDDFETLPIAQLFLLDLNKKQ